MAGNLPKMAVSQNQYTDICDTVRKICEDFPGEYWRGQEDLPLGEGYPEDFIKALEEAGIMAAGVPEKFDGVGLPLSALAEIVTTIHESGCNGSAFVAQSYLTAILLEHASEAQKSELLPKLATGELRFQCLAISENGTGDDIEQMSTFASKTDHGFSISGSKSRAPFAVISDYVLVLARSDASTGTTLFIIDKSAAKEPYFKAEPFEEMNNDFASTIVFNDLTVSAQSAIGTFGSGVDILEGTADFLRILNAAAAIGDGRFFSRRGVAYANERVVFGNLIGKYQGIQFPLAKAQVEIEAASLSLRKAVTLHDNGADASVAAMVARHLSIEAAWAMADAAFTTHGGFAFAREYDIERKWRDVRASRLSATPFKTDLLWVGETALGLPRSY